MGPHSKRPLEDGWAGDCILRGEKIKLEGLGQSRWGTKPWETESVCKIPLGLSLDKRCSLGDTRVPQEPHTAQEGQSPQVTPNRRHSLLSGVSLSPKHSRTPESIPYHQFYFHLPLPGHRPSTQQLPTCRHTLTPALLESPKTWSPPTSTFHGLTWHHSTEHAKARPLTLRSLQGLTWLCPPELSRACAWPPPPSTLPDPAWPRPQRTQPRAARRSAVVLLTGHAVTGKVTRRHSEEWYRDIRTLRATVAACLSPHGRRDPGPRSPVMAAARRAFGRPDPSPCRC